MTGFVYIWHDTKKNWFYVGSHWGTPDDGYVCSSLRMKRAYRRRPETFRRRIIATILTNRKDLLIEEQRWLLMIPYQELGFHKNRKNGTARYYNLINRADHHWYADDAKRLRVSEKMRLREVTPEARHNMSDAAKLRFSDPYERAKIGIANKGNILSSEHRATIAEQQRERWKDPDYAANAIAALDRGRTAERGEARRKNHSLGARRKLSIEIKKEIAIKYALGEKNRSRDLAIEYGVSPSLICKIHQDYQANPFLFC